MDKNSTWSPSAWGLAWLRCTEMHSGRKSSQSFNLERDRDSTWKYCTSEKEEENADSESCAKKRQTCKSDLVCGFGEGPVEIIFILKVEVSGLSDHNKHGQPGFRLWLRWLQGVWTVGGGLGYFPLLSLCFSSSTPTPAAVDVGHHGEFVQSHSVGGKD